MNYFYLQCRRLQRRCGITGAQHCPQPFDFNFGRCQRVVRLPGLLFRVLRGRLPPATTVGDIIAMIDSFLLIYEIFS